MRRDILKYYYYVQIGTWSCEKDRIFQSSKNWLSRFMPRYNFTKKKLSNKKVKDIEEMRAICQFLHSFFFTCFIIKIVIHLNPTERSAIMVLSTLTVNTQWTK